MDGACKSQIVTEDWRGWHNRGNSADRILQGNTYIDSSTIAIVPTRGVIPAKVVQSWMSMMMPMNQKFTRFFMIGMAVDHAYNAAIENILAHPDLSTWKYILTLEEDNMPPPDGLLKLIESIQHVDVVGGLYWTKGEGGQPMIYGNPGVMPKNFIPQVPVPESLQPCNGLGMGFTLFKLDIFKKMKPPWFRTLQEYSPQTGIRCYTQDLYFFEEAAKYGYKFACDTRVRVGHYDYDGRAGQPDTIW